MTRHKNPKNNGKHKIHCWKVDLDEEYPLNPEWKAHTIGKVCFICGLKKIQTVRTRKIGVEKE